ncbi:unnamed protein product [Parnassius apollo]|uniref:(apollo) hypothetical protein n=1 Tax=Parnassius apollo TaxID=110799 RepID=A0A8S3X068_PARAO|nr:unnamed protein product [Parnassius apollo]
MRALLTVLCLTITICLSHGKPPVPNSLIIRQRRESDVFGNTRQLVKELVEGLRGSARQAMEAIGNFSTGIQKEVKLVNEKINTEVQKLQGQIDDGIKSVTARFTNATEIVTDCVKSHQQQAEDLINRTFVETRACVDDRIQQLSYMIGSLEAQSVGALDYANNVIESMRKCTTEDTENIIYIGSCIGPIALQAQIKSIIFIAQSGVSIARINFAIGMLPAAFEICAGSNMMEASVGTAKIVIDIGSCSASSIYSSLISIN